MHNRHLRQAALGILLLIFFCLMGVHRAQAAPLTAQTNRIYGATRIETAIKVAQAGWSQASTVLLARADDFPDALVAVPLSYKLDAPILLTYANLDPQVLAEIKSLGAQHVILLGGSGVLGQGVTQPLEQAGLTWEQIGGADRYATAAMIADRVGPDGQVILASGENFPDALAIGPYAGITGTPILLTGSKALPDSTRQELNKLLGNNLPGEGEGEGAPRTLVIGGEGVIPSQVLAGVPGVTRIAGQDRYETAAKVYWFAAQQVSFGQGAAGNQAYLVTGEDFPDALVAGALAAKEDAPLFMSGKVSLPAETYSAMGNAADNPLTVTLLGGSGVLSDQVRGMVAGTIQPPYLLGGLTVAVDPGHGGPDTGAIGPGGSYEKNNTLAVGLDLADLLRAAGAKVIMTRTTDAAPSGANYTEKTDLETRVNLANAGKADLFVSIHNDSFTNPQAGGTTTYYCSANPQAAQAKQLGQDVQAQVVNQLGLQDRGVKDADFYVIKYTNMPAVLVELGFISNPTEEKLLGSPDFQAKAALGIYRGILVYHGV